MIQTKIQTRKCLSCGKTLKNRELLCVDCDDPEEGKPSLKLPDFHHYNKVWSHKKKENDKR